MVMNESMNRCVFLQTREAKKEMIMLLVEQQTHITLTFKGMFTLLHIN